MERRRTMGGLLREARLRAGLTQQELAQKAGVSIGTVRDLEQDRGSRPRARSLDRLADALDVGQEWRTQLLRFAERRAPAPVGAAGPARILILGPLSLVRDSQPVRMGTGGHRIVLARLAMTPDRMVTRDELVDLLWKGESPPTATNILQSHVSRLRRLLDVPYRSIDGSLLRFVPGGYVLRADDQRLDLLAYRNRLSESRSPTIDSLRRYELLTDALNMWRSENAANDVPELDNHPLVVALAQERADAGIRLAQIAERLERQAEIVPLLRGLCRGNPWHEPLHARLMVALAATGQQAASLEVFDDIRRRLTGELGVDPCPELLDAHQSVLNGRGNARQPVASGQALPIRPRQAPSPPQDFVGRTEELVRLERLLRGRQHGASACCVISGMAGVGKTSLALQIAWSLQADYPDGQVYIDLRGTDNRPIDVMYTLARLLRALGVDRRSIPTDSDEASALYRSVLSERRVLVVLDNAHDAAQVRPLLSGPGASAVLVTSRDLCLELDGALLMTLSPLDLDEAVEMLTTRAEAARVAEHRDDVRALAEACGRLPLALRIVSGRLAAHLDQSPADLLDRLAGERSAIEQLRIGEVAVTASFELSYRALGPAPARAFRTAALMPGLNFSPAALGSMLVLGEKYVEMVLEHLVTTNLLQRADTGRYQFHDLLRAYAIRCAQSTHGAAERSEATGRLFEWYLARTAAAMRLVYASMVRLPIDVDTEAHRFPDESAALHWLDEEIDNLVAAIEASATGAHRPRSWQLADQLRGYFFLRRDAVAWLKTGQIGLSAAMAAGDHQAQAAMHQTVGQAYWSIGENRRADDEYRLALDAAERSGWTLGTAYLLHNLGLVRANLGRGDEALDLYRRALEVGDGPEFVHVRAVTLNDLGTSCAQRGDLTQAVHYLTRALAINNDPSRHKSAIVNRVNLGMVLRQLEEFESAREHLEIALEHYQRIAAPRGEMSTLDELSQLHRQCAEWDAAVRTATEALRIATQLNDALSEAGTLNTLGFALLGTGAVTDARTRFAEASRISREKGYQYFEVQACVGRAEAALVDGDLQQAYAAAGNALHMAEGKSYRLLLADALVVQGRAALRTGDSRAAVKHCRDARAHFAAANVVGRVRDCDAVISRAMSMHGDGSPAADMGRHG